MSKVAIQGNASGTGTLTIAAPNTNTDRTLTLPDEAGTVLTSGGAIDVDASAPADSVAIDSSGNVGVGTSSPSTPLHIASSTGDTSVKIESTFAGGDARLELIGNSAGVSQIRFGDENSANIGLLTYNHTDDSMAFRANGGERARIDSSGNFYLSGNQTLGPLTDNQGTIGDGSHRWRVIYAVNGTIQTSDVTQKTDVQASSLGLDFINSLNPVSFRWIDSTYGRTHYGFIAQEIEQTLNDSNAGDFGGLVIDEMEDGSRLYGLRHHELIAPMVKAMQEQQALITAQQTALQEALTKIETLEARVAALEGN